MPGGAVTLFAPETKPSRPPILDNFLVGQGFCWRLSYSFLGQGSCRALEGKGSNLVRVFESPLALGASCDSASSKHRARIQARTPPLAAEISALIALPETSSLHSLPTPPPRYSRDHQMHPNNLACSAHYTVISLRSFPSLMVHSQFPCS